MPTGWTAKGGDDILEGGAGADTLNGGRGDDWLISGSESDVLMGGDGNDNSYGSAYDGDSVISSVSYFLSEGMQSLTLAGVDGGGFN